MWNHKCRFLNVSNKKLQHIWDIKVLNVFKIDVMSLNFVLIVVQIQIKDTNSFDARAKCLNEWTMPRIEKKKWLPHTVCTIPATHNMDGMINCIVRLYTINNADTSYKKCEEKLIASNFKKVLRQRLFRYWDKWFVVWWKKIIVVWTVPIFCLLSLKRLFRSLYYLYSNDKK